MGNPTGFLEIDRHDRSSAKISERVSNFREFVIPLPLEETRKQAERCMGCGIPYCHTGCPVNNQIPDWNDLVFSGNFRQALADLHSTNNFPEFTGRVCPAPCEAACTLNLDDAPVTIKGIECAIVDRGWVEGWIQPEISPTVTGKTVAIVGSGPAGLACAQQLARTGYEVHVFEKNSKAGGLLRYGIPDFKLSKLHIDRRLAQLEAEGVIFHFNTHVGVDVPTDKLVNDYDAVVIAAGAEEPRQLSVPGSDLRGVHLAMEFLCQQNRRCSGEPEGAGEAIVAEKKHVVVIGGGDTGSDCIGTAIRQGAKSVTNLELMPKPPEYENKLLSWPHWPLKLRTSSSHEEGAIREFSVLTQRFSGENGSVKRVDCVHINSDMQPIPGTEFSIEADLVLIAMGFVHCVHSGMVASFGAELDERGNVSANSVDYKTSTVSVFAAGDVRRGQSLVVWAIREGRQAARSVDQYLGQGISILPR